MKIRAQRDALLNYCFYSDRSLADNLVPGISAPEKYIRLSVILISLLFGIIISLSASRSQEIINGIENEKINPTR
ncbi:hypothetical protein [uncultured Methanolobus sp.]|uniref:hypothetical protein n=1 Tax=uncultured Methanolobus sp. TaxID=218300 RepID=UPI002AAC2B0A|nr:hypothetical protein [uncultured Methanolobus sp.]